MKDYAGEVLRIYNKGGVYFHNADPKMVETQTAIVLEETNNFVIAIEELNRDDAGSYSVSLTHALLALACMADVHTEETDKERMATVFRNADLINKLMNNQNPIKCTYCSPLFYVMSALNTLLVEIKDSGYKTISIKAARCVWIVWYLLKFCKQEEFDFTSLWDAACDRLLGRD